MVEKMPTTKDKFFFYGSLRKGCYNNSIVDGKEPDTFAKLNGFKMFSLGSYPFITETDDNKDIVLGEIYSDLTPRQLEYIDGMELGAGYYRKFVSVIDQKNKKHDVWVYAKNSHDDNLNNFTAVPNNDWVTFKNVKENKSLHNF